MQRFLSWTLVASALLLLSACESPGPRDSIGPSPQTVNRNAELQTRLGMGYLREGKYELAWQRLNKALDADPRYSTAHNAMALLYERIGQAEKARTHYSAAIKHNPSDSSAHTNYGSFLCRQGELEAAEEQFQLAIGNALYETPEIPYANLGLCMSQVGRRDDAEKYLRRALELNPRIPGALIAMSDLSLQKGEQLSARAYMQRYAEVAPHSPRTLWLGIQIERALGDRDTAASYAMRLKNQYPDSNETRLLLESESQWQ